MSKPSKKLPQASKKDSKGKSKKFPFRDDLSGKCDYFVRIIGKNIDIINVNSPESNAQALKYKRELDFKHFKFLFHGTTFQHAFSIVNTGICVERGRAITDFGQGFYLSEDFDYAKQYPTQGERSVLIFKVELETWQRDLDSYGYDFGTDVEQWTEFVAFNRGEIPRTKIDLSGKKFIRGHVCKNNLKPGTSKQKLYQDPAMQVCLKDPDYAKTFIKYLSAVVSYTNL